MIEKRKQFCRRVPLLRINKIGSERLGGFVLGGGERIDSPVTMTYIYTHTHSFSRWDEAMTQSAIKGDLRPKEEEALEQCHLMEANGVAW